MNILLIIYFTLSIILTCLLANAKKFSKELIGYKQRAAFIIVILVIAPIAALFPKSIALLLSKINNYIKKYKENK